MKKICLILFLTSFLGASQDYNYFEKSKLGYASSITSLIRYDTLNKESNFFDIDEKLYKSIFYKGYFTEKSSNSSFYKLTLLFLKQIEISPNQFKDYKLILNPQLKKTEYSEHLLTVNIIKNLTYANLQTKLVEIIFSENILKKAKDSTKTNLLIKTDLGLQHNNQKRGTFFKEGIEIQRITGFEMYPSYLLDAPILLIDFENATVDFRVKKKYDLIFEDSNISNLIYDYQGLKKFNGKWGLKIPEGYTNAIQFKNVESVLNFGKKIHKCKISEIYFFEDMTAGTIQYDSEKEIKSLLMDLGYKSNESKELIKKMLEPITKKKITKRLREFLNSNKKMRFTIKTEYNSLKLIFFTKNEVDVSSKISQYLLD